MELLRLRERIELAREMGESHFREFKSAFEGPSENKTARDFRKVCQDIGQTLVAFANADGGELLVGVEDNGEITGLDYSDNTINGLLNAAKTYVHQNTPLPSTKATIVEFDGKKVIYFSVQKGTDYVYITSDGKCLQRKDLDSIPIPPEEIKFERAEVRSREYDRIFLDNADIVDLDKDLLSYVAREFSKTISPEKFLQHLELAEFDGNKLRLRKAALLLFSKEPTKWHPRLQVRILKVSGTEIKTGKEFNVVKDEQVTDNILRLIETSWDLLRPYLTETKFSQDALFKSQIIYPELACREALINAIAHRDYSIEGQGIEVYVFDDRLEIRSPGELLSSIKVSDLKERKGIHQSRNSNIARVLREIGYMRELGEGFRRIFELMETNDLTPPELISSNNAFAVKLHQKYVYTNEEKIWLDNFKNIPLTREQRTVVRLGARGELISPKMIWDAVGIVDTDEYRQLIESLKVLSILESKVSKPEVMTYARKNRISDKKRVPRFLIKVPSTSKDGIKDVSKINSDKNVLDQRVEKMNKFLSGQELDDAEYVKMFIENLPYDVTEQEVAQVFNKYGEISQVTIPKSYYTHRGRGFAIIEFQRKESFDEAMKDKMNIFLRQRKVICKNYFPKTPHRS